MICLKPIRFFSASTTVDISVPQALLLLELDSHKLEDGFMMFHLFCIRQQYLIKRSMVEHQIFEQLLLTDHRLLLIERSCHPLVFNHFIYPRCTCEISISKRPFLYVFALII